jgi:hypothetical protein
VSIIGYTWWLATQAFELLFSWWPVTLLLIGAVVISARGAEHEPARSQQRSLTSVLFLFPVLSLIWGALARQDDPIAPPSLWKVLILALIVLSQVAASTAVVYVAHKQRWHTAAICGLIGWFSALCVYLSWMAITGAMAVTPEL